MKKILISLFLAGVIGISLAGAQNFSDNDYQRAGREFEAQAKAAMTAGEYENAGILAEKAAVEYRKSREFGENQTLMFRASTAINLAQIGVTGVEKSKQAKTSANELAEAKSLLKEARTLFTAKTWVTSREKALASLDIIKAITGTEVAADPNPAGVTLPRYYVVVKRPSNTDCYWNIAKMKEIYGKGALWHKLYQANKAKMRDPENPDLIYPGMIIEIPSIGGEAREGTYKAGTVYKTLP